MFTLRSPGRRAQRNAILRYEPLPPISLEQARNHARTSLANGYLPLIDPDDGAVHHLFHRGPKPPGEARLVGGEFTPAGDTRSGWYAIQARDGTMHLFHGPSVASVAFRRNQ